MSELDLAARIFNRHTVNPVTGCWEWSGSRTSRGYGRFKIPTGKIMLAHRASYMVHKGEIPSGLYICHHCDNPCCINPDHLFAGTNADNMADCARKGRSAGLRNIGQVNGRSVISEIDAKVIAKSAEPHKVLAQRYGVSRSTITHLKTGRTWRHISND